MSSHKNINEDSADLQVSGSQMTLLSSPCRTPVAKQLRSPNSVNETDKKPKRPLSAKSNTSLISESSRRKTDPSSPVHNLFQSSVSRSVTGTKSNTNYAKPPRSDVFTSMFGDNNKQKQKPTSARSKKPSQHLNTDIRPFARSPMSSTQTTPRQPLAKDDLTDDIPADIHYLNGVSFSSDDSIAELKVDEILSRSLNKAARTFSPKNSLSDNQKPFSVFSGMDDALNSHRTMLSSSCNTPRSLTSIANNMTSQAMSPQAKASLSSIENSYQNFKSKAPINQVRKDSNQSEPPNLFSKSMSSVNRINSAASMRSSHSHAGSNKSAFMAHLSSSESNRVNYVNSNTNAAPSSWLKSPSPVNAVVSMMSNPSSANLTANAQAGTLMSEATAATMIQQWYRRHRVRRKACEAAMKRLLMQKRQEIIQQQREERDEALRKKDKATEREILKEIRAKESRQKAIQDMHKRRSERQGEVGKQLDPVVRPRLFQRSLSSSSCASSRTVTMKTSNLRNVNSNITAATTTTTTATAAVTTASTATKTPMLIAASSLMSTTAAATTTITTASGTSATTTTTTAAAAPTTATTLSPPVAAQRNRRNVFYESLSTNKDYSQHDSKAGSAVSISPQMSSINLGAGENCMLDHLKVTDDCDSRLEELFKETSKLVKVANSTLRRNSHTSSVPISQLPTPDRNTPEPGFEPPIINSDARASKTPTKSTLSDLLETLKKLEEDEDIGAGDLPLKSTSRVSDLNGSLKVGGGSNKSRCSSRSRCATKEGATPKTSPHLTAENLQQLNQDQHPLSPPDDGIGYLSNDKLQSIISFLDEVQSADRITDIELKAYSVTSGNEVNDTNISSVTPIKALNLEEATATAAEITNNVMSQRLELDEKKQSVELLQKALNQQRELTVRHAKEAEKEMKRLLQHQKDQYENTIKRHLSFIDQLIDDKKMLNEKCEQLVKELKTMDRKHQDKMKNQTDKYNTELKKFKELSLTSEKIRREKWIEDKTKKIKEMTVKGLEPEIQRLIAKHKGEMNKVKQIHEAELLESDERAAQRYVKLTEDLRSQLAKEKEEACSHERELAKQRYEKQIHQEEESFQNERRRLYSEIEDEKRRLASQSCRERAEIDRLQQQLHNAHQQLLSSTKEEFDKAREEQERRHASELQALRDRMAVEKEAWEENFLKKQETLLLSKERDLKEKVRKDRDREIELVINRLEADATQAREELERTAQNRIKRIREKCEAEVKELEQSEKLAISRYNEIKAELTDVEGINEQLKVKLKQKIYEIDSLNKTLEKFHKERDAVADVVRQEFVDKIVATEEESRRTKQEMSELKARHRIELERCRTEIEKTKKQKENELDDVHERVKQAIVKKDEVVTQLKKEYQAAVKRADHLEGLLEQQRKHLLGK
ncbi:serine-rich adhesin for platelets [Octopus sinensis]|uniref:Serine-rich adhesin for platelets n=1 Tax=Octopus sinensis TaxID=2607531 RepID=A0A6P7TJ84_9MOLL|nr:serine-rich adhesin for platelets [Octopus sinensis]